MTVLMTLNNYDFPKGVPVLAIQESHNRTSAGQFFSRTTRGTLTGHLLGFAGDCPTSLSRIVDLQNEMRSAIVSCSGCPVFEIYCDDDLVLSANARVLDVQIDTSSDNWTMTAPYTISLEWDNPESSGIPCDTCLRNISENWGIEQIPPFQHGVSFESGCDVQTFEMYKVTHSLSASATDCCFSGIPQSGWVIAKDWVEDHAASGMDTYALINFSGLNEKFLAVNEIYEHIRSYNYSPTDGSFSLEENWVVAFGFSGIPYREEFEVSEKFERQNRFREFTVSGSIVGYEKRDPLTYNVVSTRLQNAEDRWAIINQSGVSNRLSCYFDLVCPVNPIPVSYSIGKNPANGSINFTYTFDERPAVMFSGAQYENISITDNRSSYNIVPVPVLGRMAGPLLLNSNTTNQRQKSVSVSVIYPSPSGCVYPSGICERINFMEDDLLSGEPVLNSFLCCMETRLNSQYDLVYKVNDTVQYDPIGGSYQRDVSWTYQKCAIPILDICVGTGYE